MLLWKNESMKTSFTIHAWARVYERLSLSPSDVADILDWDLAVNIGADAGSNRVHRLFYSSPDEMCFVAVQDSKTNAVITILPIDYHENISWKVSIDAQDQAKTLICPTSNEQPPVNVTVDETLINSDFKIKAYANSDSGKIRIFSLGSWPSSPYQASFEKLFDDKDFLTAIEERLKNKLSQGDQIESIYVCLGKK
jgi:hypothetical protein